MDKLNEGMTYNSVGICPRFGFHCNARITRVRFRLHIFPDGYRCPCIQIWRPIFQGSQTFNKVGEVFATKYHIVKLSHEEATIPLTGSSRMRVQSGDVIGYGHPTNVAYNVRTRNESGQQLYEFFGYSANITTLNLNDADHRYDARQPLVNFKIGK